MSLYKFSQFASAPNKMHQRQRAVIYDNNDPEKLGRVRVIIPGIFEEADKGKHPWIYPHSDHQLNGNEKQANIHIPRIGSSINVEFHGGSAYHGVYTGTYRNKNNTANKPFETNYPYRYGTVDATGNETIHDMKEHTFTYKHYAIDDDQSSDGVDEGDENSTSSSSSSFSAKRKVLKATAPTDGESEDSGQQPKMSHGIGKDGSITTDTQGNHTTSTEGDSNHAINGSMSTTSIKNMLLKTAQSMVHQATSDITHSAGSDIIHKATKIFLN